MGRTPNWNPVSLIDESAWLEAVEIGSDDRLCLPIGIRRRAGWGRLHRAISLLAIITDENAIELLAWEPHGRHEMEKLGEALSHVDNIDRDGIILAAMDRYSRASLARDGRLILPSPLAIHLGIGASKIVRASFAGGRVLLWSEETWQATRRDRLTRLRSINSIPARLPSHAAMPQAVGQN